MTRTAVYRAFDGEGALLYVGRSVNPLSRSGGHNAGSDWFLDVSRIDVEWFDTFEQAEAAEREAIATGMPRFNIQHSTVNRAARQVYAGAEGEPVLGLSLGPAKTIILRKLMEDGDAGSSRASLLDALYRGATGAIPKKKVLDVQICNLRAALPASIGSIETLWGYGYRFQPSPQKSAEGAV